MDSATFNVIKLNQREKFNRIKDYVRTLIPKLIPSEDVTIFTSNESMMTFVQALTHPSFSEDFNYERMEKLGDAILGSAITKLVYDHFPEFESPEDLTGVDQKYLDKDFLSSMSDEFGLSNLIILGDEVLSEEDIIDAKEDTFEAFIGSLSLVGDKIADCYGYKLVYELVKFWFKPKINYEEIRNGRYKKYVTRLKEYADIQRKHVEYRTSEKHDTVLVTVLYGPKDNLQKVGSAKNRIQRYAKEDAAKIAYNTIVK